MSNNYISVSEMKEFQECPYKWWIHRVLRKKEKFLTSNIVKGRAVHGAIETIFKEKRTPNFKEVYDKIFEELTSKDHVIEYGDWDSYEDDIETGTEMVEVFQGVLEEDEPKILAIEVSGLFDIPEVPKPIYIGIDFIAEHNGETIIGDFKTGKSGPPPHYMAYDMQLHSYAYGLAKGRSITDFCNLKRNPETQQYFGRKASATTILNLHDGLKKKKPWHSKDLWYVEPIPDAGDKEMLKDLINTYKAIEFVKENKCPYRHTAGSTNSPCKGCSYNKEKQGICNEVTI